MSIDLDVFVVRAPENLRDRWPAALADCGTGWSVRPFKSWRAALKDAVPEYAGG